jgi:hypothetical protein
MFESISTRWPPSGPPAVSLKNYECSAAERSGGVPCWRGRGCRQRGASAALAASRNAARGDGDEEQRIGEQACLTPICSELKSVLTGRSGRLESRAYCAAHAADRARETHPSEQQHGSEVLGECREVVVPPPWPESRASQEMTLVVLADVHHHVDA